MNNSQIFHEKFIAKKSIKSVSICTRESIIKYTDFTLGRCVVVCLAASHDPWDEVSIPVMLMVRVLGSLNTLGKISLNKF